MEAPCAVRTLIASDYQSSDARFHPLTDGVSIIEDQGSPGIIASHQSHCCHVNVGGTRRLKVDNKDTVQSSVVGLLSAKQG